MILSKYSNVRHSMLLIVWEAKRPINLLHFSMNRKFHKIISQQRIGHIQIYRNALLDSCLFFQYFGYLKYGRIVYREMSQTEHISSCQCRPIDLKAESLLPTNEKPLDLLRPVWSYFKSCFGWTELHTRLKSSCRTGKKDHETGNALMLAVVMVLALRLTTITPYGSLRVM